MCDPIVYAAIAAGNLLQARAAERASNAFAEQAAEEQREQIKDQRTDLAIEVAQKENQRWANYQDQLAGNRALLASMGLTEQGGSYLALKQQNRNIVKTDLRNVSIEKGKTLRELSYAELDVERNLMATKMQNRQNTVNAYFDLAQAGTELAESKGFGNFKNNKSNTLIRGGKKGKIE